MAKKQSTAVLKFDDVKIIWRTIIQNWYVPVILVPLLYLIGYFVAYRQFETYQVSTQLLLKSNDQYYKSNVINEVGDFYGGGGSFVDNSNEMRVIKSYNLVEKVVEKLRTRLQVSYYIVGRVRTSEQFNGMPFSVFINSIHPSFNEQKFSLKVTGEKTFELGYKEGEKEIKKQGVFGKELIDDKYNLLINKTSDFGADYVKEVKSIQYEFIPHAIETLVS
ncbi:MAG TPA: hypothetical protein VNY73_08565, partial [Bacteroidia bacterium]|nr:hypothetical protein [Bacteroidia bacterium]